MTLPLVDASIWFRIVYAVIFTFIFFLGLISFIQSFKLKGGRYVHLSLFFLVTIDGLFEVLASCLHAKAIVGLPKGYQKSYIYVLSNKLNFVQVASQNTLILALLFMWIELFQTIKFGNFVEQEKTVRKYAIARTICMVSIWILNFLTLFLPVQINGVVVPLFVWITFIPLGCFMVPVLIMAIIRWKMLYNVMKDCLRSHTRNGDRFIDLTKATCFAINSYFWDNFFAGYTQGVLAAPNVVFYVFVSMIPNTLLPSAIIWYFSPMRKRQYKEDQGGSSSIPGVSNITDSGKGSQVSASAYKDASDSANVNNAPNSADLSSGGIYEDEVDADCKTVVIGESKEMTSMA